MSASEIVAVMAGLTALLGAISVLMVQVHKLELRVDGRLSELLELTRSSARAEGVLEGTSTPSPVLSEPHRDAS